MRAGYKVNGRSLEDVNAESNRPGGDNKLWIIFWSV